MELKVENFRITNITKIEEVKIKKGLAKIQTKTLEDKDGLNIEYTLDNGKSYFVLSTIRYEHGCKIEECGTRVLEYITRQNYDMYKELCKIACSAVMLLNAECIN